ncbi:MAG: CBS domain-containing protein [Betaproteobacteria bacterium]|jgi:CBS domain-containing protein
MKVSDILRLKGNTLYSVTPETNLHSAIHMMADHDIGSVVVIQYSELVGMLTFREVIGTLAHHHAGLDQVTVGSVMDEMPLTCTPETDLDEVRRMMLDRHTRYLPVLEKKMLMGVISFYDVAKAVVDAQDFENTMLKAYIRDWPQDVSE